MTKIEWRDLLDNAEDVIRQVADGEALDITRNGRPVARLVPPSGKPTFVPAEELLAHPADPGLLDDIRDVLADEPTDDAQDPWERQGL
jgi:prevent-host-death family protein